VDTAQTGRRNIYNDVFNTEDPFSHGINIFDLNTMSFRSNYVSQPNPYAMNIDIQGWYNNHARIPDFNNNGLVKLFQTETFNDADPSTPSGISGVPAGAIEGGVVGGLAVLVLTAVAI